jgi:hypothetical protein
MGVGMLSEFLKIRKRLLYETSKHLAAALNGGNQEAQDQCIELPEENPSMFERFQLWIYYGNLIFDEENIKDVRWAPLLTVYIVAVAHDLPAPQDLTIDIPIDKEWTELTPPTSQVQYLYDNTHKTVPLRKLLVDWNPHCGGSSSTDWFEDRNRLNQEQYRRNYHFANDERQWRI